VAQGFASDRRFGRRVLGVSELLDDQRHRGDQACGGHDRENLAEAEVAPRQLADEK